MNVKEAVNVAKATARDLYGEELRDMRLEEVEIAEGSSDWKVTLSFLFPDKNPPQPAFLFPNLAQSHPYERVYKLFIVGSESGQVKAMRIRET